MHAELQGIVSQVLQAGPYHRPYSIGISGIDGAGKGYIAEQLRQALEQAGLKVAVVGIDGWLAKPSERFSDERPAQHFFEHGIRFNEFYQHVYQPLIQYGSLDFTALHASPSNDEAYHEFHYHIEKVQVLIFEGIFLFQDPFSFDLKVWVDCSFETALERALVRNQEGLSAEEIRADYQRVYFPAQELYFKKCRPRLLSDSIIDNDQNH